MTLRRVLPAVAALVLFPLSMMPGAVAQGASQQTQQTQQAQSKALAAANSGDKIDINSASVGALKGLPGIGDAYAQRIIKGRPYQNKAQLATRGVLPQGTYDKIKARVIATQPK